MVSRAVPPEIEGHVFERELGRGGFADVFLYRQELPARPVAIKVLREPVRTEADRLSFEREANRMAALSGHPGIVTIYAVGTAPDGRPYLSMEFCPHGHLGAAVAERPLSLARSLEVGVKLAAAVESAHRASILHRDIKPANVLLTAYDEPALIDFGIAGGREDDATPEEDASRGLTIAFSAPEVIRNDTPGDEASDVYALGATVYALLAGRSPFHGPEVSSQADLLRRVLAGSPPPTGRVDVPESLEHVLATALRRSPGDRYASAAEFGRALQDVQVEVGSDRTPMQLDGGSRSAVRREADDEDGTRLRPITRFGERSEPESDAGTRATDGLGVGSSTGTRRIGDAEPGRRSSWERSEALSPGDLGERTVRRAARSGRGDASTTDDAPADDGGERSDGRGRLIASILGAVVALAVVGLVVLRVGARDDAGTVTTTTTPPDGPLVTGGPPRPERVRIEPGETSGQTVTWSVRGASEDDEFRVTITDGPASLRGDSAITDERSWDLPTDRRVCVIVETLRGSRVSTASSEVCSR